SVGRKPASYLKSAAAQRLDGLRIGVIREYMAKKLFSKADEESIEIVEHAIDDLRKLGATIVDPGPEGALFQACINSMQYRDLFPIGSAAVLSLRTLNTPAIPGEAKYMMDRY